MRPIDEEWYGGTTTETTPTTTTQTTTTTNTEPYASDDDDAVATAVVMETASFQCWKCQGRDFGECGRRGRLEVCADSQVIARK